MDMEFIMQLPKDFTSRKGAQINIGLRCESDVACAQGEFHRTFSKCVRCRIVEWHNYTW
eukprot:COSAG02_NODE_34513_length_483_cov_0.570312_2_plen_58_part_01